MDESIPELMYTMMSLLFLLLGVVLIASIVMSTINPYDQVTFANVEKLRSAMNQACYSGGTSAVKFSLPQNTPAITGIFPVLPTWIINTNGDPNYVLYYDSFPPGEAAGWETYQNMQNRIVAYLPAAADGENSEYVVNYVKSVVDKANARGVKNIEGVVIGNIELSNTRSDFFMGETAGGSSGGSEEMFQGGRSGGGGAPGGGEGGAPKYGAWNEKDPQTGIPVAGDNYFKFNSYITLNNFEKSSIKYETCGANSLCLKTRSGVYRFSLDQCSNVKGVQMVYDDRNRAVTYGSAIGAGLACYFTGGLCATIASGAGTVGSWIYKIASYIPFGRTVIVGGVGFATEKVINWFSAAFLTFKTQDFNIASPCEIKEMTIQKAKCDEKIPLEWAPDQKACADGTAMDVPIFQYGSDAKLHKTGDHYLCTEKTDTDKLDTPESSAGHDDQCLQIKVTDKTSGFCWTPDPYKNSVLSANWDTEGIVRFFTSLAPVHNSLSYLQVSSDSGGFVISNVNQSGIVRNSQDSPLRWQWPG